jgi:hypothetical protein
VHLPQYAPVGESRLKDIANERHRHLIYIELCNYILSCVNHSKHHSVIDKELFGRVIRDELPVLVEHPCYDDNADDTSAYASRYHWLKYLRLKDDKADNLTAQMDVLDTCLVHVQQYAHEHPSSVIHALHCHQIISVEVVQRQKVVLLLCNSV